MRTTFIRLRLISIIILSAIIVEEGKTQYANIVDSFFIISPLNKSINEYFNVKAESEIERFTLLKKGAWTRYLPSIGFGYTLVEKDGKIVGSIRPSLSVSTSVVFQMLSDRKEKRAIKKSIVISSKLEAEEEKRRLKKLIEVYHNRIAEKNLFKALVEIEVELFRIIEADYKSGVVDVPTYLRAKKVILQKEFEMKQRELELKNLRVEILEVGKVL